MSFINSKEERELLKQKLLDKNVVERLFDHIRLGIIRQREGAKGLLEGKTDPGLKISLTSYLSYLNDFDILIHILEAVTSKVAEQNQILYDLARWSIKSERDDTEVREIIEEHEKALSHYEKHKETLNWIEDYVSKGGKT